MYNLNETKNAGIVDLSTPTIDTKKEKEAANITFNRFRANNVPFSRMHSYIAEGLDRSKKTSFVHKTLAEFAIKLPFFNKEKIAAAGHILVKAKEPVTSEHIQKAVNLYKDSFDRKASEEELNERMSEIIGILSLLRPEDLAEQTIEAKDYVSGFPTQEAGWFILSRLQKMGSNLEKMVYDVQGQPVHYPKILSPLVKEMHYMKLYHDQLFTAIQSKISGIS